RRGFRHAGLTRHSRQGTGLDLAHEDVERVRHTARCPAPVRLYPLDSDKDEVRGHCVAHLFLSSPSAPIRSCKTPPPSIPASPSRPCSPPWCSPAPFRLPTPPMSRGTAAPTPAGPTTLTGPVARPPPTTSTTTSPCSAAPPPTLSNPRSTPSRFAPSTALPSVERPRWR